MQTESFGSYLKREREFRKISIEDICRETRISPSIIESLETDKSDNSSTVTFVKGYLKAYADHVGLDVEDVLLRYQQWLAAEAKNPEKVEEGKLVAKKFQWKWKYLWLTIVSGLIIGLAAYLSS